MREKPESIAGLFAILIKYFIAFFILASGINAHADSTALVYDPKSGQLLPLHFVLSGEVQVDAAEDVPSNDVDAPESNLKTDDDLIKRRDMDVQTSIFRFTGHGYRNPNWLFDSSPRGAQIVGLSSESTTATLLEVFNLASEVVEKLVINHPQHGQCRYKVEDKKKIVLKQIEYFYISCKLQTSSN